MMSYFRQVSEMNRNMLEAGKGRFESFDVKAVQEGFQAYGVSCGQKNFVYLYNSTATDEAILLTGIKMDKTKGNLNLFDCETGKNSTTRFEVMPDKSIKIDQLKLQPKGDMIISWE
jgi:hypothetical protein